MRCLTSSGPSDTFEVANKEDAEGKAVILKGLASLKDNKTNKNLFLNETRKIS